MVDKTRLGDGFDDFDDFDSQWGEAGFNGKPVGKKRAAISQVAGSFVEGAKQHLLNKNNLINFSKKALPQEFSPVIDAAKESHDTLKSLYDKAGADLKPHVNEFKRAVSKLLPPGSKFLPEKLSKKLSDWLEDRESEQARWDANQSEMTNTLTEIFQKKAEADEAQQESDKAESQIRYDIAFKQTSSIQDSVQAIRTGIDDLRGYQNKVTFAYQRKSLELQFKHYFVNKRLLDEFMKFSGFNKESMNIIARNTSLPDMVKTQNKEMIEAMAKQRLFGVLGNTAKKLTAGAADRIKKNLANKFSAWTNNLAEGLGMVSEIAEGAADGDEGGISKAQLGGILAGDAAAGVAGHFGAKPIRRYLDKSPRVKAAAKAGLRFVRDFGSNVNEFGRKGVKYGKYSEGPLGDSIFAELAEDAEQGVRESVKQAAPHTLLQKDATQTLDHATMFNVKSQMALTQVIPGWLRLIYQETHMNRTGTNKIDPLSFDYSSGKFVTRTEAVSKLHDKVFEPRQGARMKQNLDLLINTIDPSGKELTPQERIKLNSIFTNRASQGRGINLDEFSDPHFWKQFFKGEGQSDKMAALFKKSLRYNPHESWDQRALNLPHQAAMEKHSIAYKRIQEEFPELRDTLIRELEANGIEAIEHLGVTKKHGNEVHLDMAAAIEKMLGEANEATGGRTPNRPHKTAATVRGRKRRTGGGANHAGPGTHPFGGVPGTGPIKKYHSGGVVGSGPWTLYEGKDPDKIQALAKDFARKIGLSQLFSPKIESCAIHLALHKQPGDVFDYFSIPWLDKMGIIPHDADIKHIAWELNRVMATLSGQTEDLTPSRSNTVLMNALRPAQHALNQLRRAVVAGMGTPVVTPMGTAAKNAKQAASNAVQSGLHMAQQAGAVAKASAPGIAQAAGTAINKAAGEVPAILKIGEEVLTRADPRHILNQPMWQTHADKVRSAKMEAEAIARKATADSKSTAQSIGVAAHQAGVFVKAVAPQVGEAALGHLQTGLEAAKKAAAEARAKAAKVAAAQKPKAAAAAQTILNKAQAALAGNAAVAPTPAPTPPPIVTPTPKVEEHPSEDGTAKQLAHISSLVEFIAAHGVGVGNGGGPSVENASSWRLLTRLVGRSGSAALATIKGARRIHTDITKPAAKRVIDATFGAGSWAGRTAGDIWQRHKEKSDNIYVKGEEDIKLVGKLMRDGEYWDFASGKPITSIKDIKGEVRDRHNNTIISKEQFENKGVFSRRADGAMEKLFGGAKLLAGRMGQGVGTLMGFSGTVATHAKNFARVPFNVFVKGEEQPRLRASVIRAGGYRIKETGKIVTGYQDLSGTIVDAASGVEVLNATDAKMGLVDDLGNPLKTPMERLSGALIGGIDKALKLGKWAATAFNVGKKKIGAGIARLFGLRGDSPLITFFGSQQQVVERLDKIYDLLGKRLAPRDADADRAGSYEQEEAGEAAQKAKADAANQSNANATAEGKAAGTAAGAAVGTAEAKADDKHAPGGGLASKVINGVEEGAEVAGDVGTAAGAVKAVKGAKVAKEAGLAVRLAKMGKLGKVASLGLRAGSGLGRGALALAGLGEGTTAGLLGVGGSILSGAGTVAGGIASGIGAVAEGAMFLGSLLTAPVLLAVGAVAAVGLAAYGGYKLYKYLTRPDNYMGQIRMMAYGCDPTNEEHAGMIGQLESMLADKIVFNGANPTFSPKINGAELVKIFHISGPDDSRFQEWSAWFQYRFKPVYMSWLMAAKDMQGSTKLEDLDTKMKAKDKLTFLSRTSFGTGGNSPYAIIASPFKDEKKIPYSASDVSEFIQNAQKRIQSKGDKDLKEEKKPPLKGTPDAEKKEGILGIMKNGLLAAAKGWWNAKKAEFTAGVMVAKAVGNFVSKAVEDSKIAIQEGVKGYQQGGLSGGLTAGAKSLYHTVTGDAKKNKDALIAEMIAQGIKDPKEQAMLLAQMDVESGSFSKVEENLNYKPDRLMAISATARRAGIDAVTAAVNNGPEAIANLLYGGRMGNTGPNDGYMYRGRGFVQLTGKSNYATAGKALGIDLINNPDLAATPAIAAKVALWYWKSRVPQKAAEDGDVTAVTKAINGGTIGLSERNAKYGMYLSQAQQGSLVDTSAAAAGAGGAAGAVAAALKKPVPNTPAKAAAMTPGTKPTAGPIPTVTAGSTSNSTAAAPKVDFSQPATPAAAPKPTAAKTTVPASVVGSVVATTFTPTPGVASQKPAASPMDMAVSDFQATQAKQAKQVDFSQRKAADTTAKHTGNMLDVMRDQLESSLRSEETLKALELLLQSIDKSTQAAIGDQANTAGKNAAASSASTRPLTKPTQIAPSPMVNMGSHQQ